MANRDFIYVIHCQVYMSLSIIVHVGSFGDNVADILMIILTGTFLIGAVRFAEKYFSSLTAIYTRQKNRRSTSRVLKGKIYEENGKEIIETAIIHKESEKEKYKQCITDTSALPIDPIGFYNIFIDNREVIDGVIAAGKLLEQIGDAPNKNTIRNAIAGYIIDELEVIKKCRLKEKMNHSSVYMLTISYCLINIKMIANRIYPQYSIKRVILGALFNVYISVVYRNGIAKKQYRFL